MLRITPAHSDSDAVTLRLEGHLVGAWIAELAEVSERVLSSGRRLALDLGDVSLIERPGFEFLHSLARRGVSFVRCSPFQEEQLRHAAFTHLATITSQHHDEPA